MTKKEDLQVSVRGGVVLTNGYYKVTNRRRTRILAAESEAKTLWLRGLFFQYRKKNGLLTNVAPHPCQGRGSCLGGH